MTLILAIALAAIIYFAADPLTYRYLRHALQLLIVWPLADRFAARRAQRRLAVARAAYVQWAMRAPATVQA